MGLFKETDKAAEKKTKKKDGKPSATTPWKPGSLLSYPKEPGYRYRWCSKTALTKREAEGWMVVEDKRGNIVKDQKKTMLDGAPIASTVELRELILMRMPNERAEVRAKHYADLATDNAKANIRNFENEAASVADGYDGGGAYGKIQIKQEERDD